MEYIEPLDLEHKPMLWLFLRIADLSYGAYFSEGYTVSDGVRFDISDRYGGRVYDRDKWAGCETLLRTRYETDGSFFETDYLIGVNSEEGVKRAIERWNGSVQNRALTPDCDERDFQREVVDFYYELKAAGNKGSIRLDVLKLLGESKGFIKTGSGNVSIDNSQKLLLANSDKAEQLVSRLLDRGAEETEPIDV